jgi:hypothetical protein
MATTQNTHTGNGSLTEYSFTFPYLEEPDVKVSLDGVDQATSEYSFANATTISFNTAPPNGVAIRIYRQTSQEAPPATFFAGSAIRAQDLNDNFLQQLYVAQETAAATVAASTGDLADGAITSNLIANNAVSEAKLGTDSVTTVKIAANNVTSAKLAIDSVTTAKIVGGAVTEAKLATDAVTTTKIIDDAVTSAKIADATIVAGNLADSAVITAKIADDAVTLAKLADETSKAIEAPFAPFKGFGRPYNTLTGSLVADTHTGGSKFGKGNILSSHFTGHRQGNYTSTDGKVYTFGNQYHNGTQGLTYYSAGAGTSNYAWYEPITAQPRMPRWFHAALAGESTEAKWLTDLDGVSLGYTNRTTYPKIISCLFSKTNRWYLTENGMLFAQGYTGYSLWGNGYNGGNGVVPMVVQFYDSTGATALTGANRPKIKHVVATNAADDISTTNSVYALDTDGKVYRWGHNNQGQLGDNSTTTNYYARQIDQVYFDNEPVVYITCGGGPSYTSVYAITNTGRLFVWGYNGYGQLGMNDTVTKLLPVEATAVTGSGIQDKTITHVISTGGGSSVTKTVVMDSDGILYSAGGGESYGVYLGRYDSANAANKTTFERLTDDTTTYLSDNQKAVSVWCAGGRYPTWFVITNGGDSNQPKVYSWGANNRGQLARNANTSNTASASVQGDWFLGECTFQDFGDLELNSAGTSNVRPNEIRDQTMYSSSWTNKHTFGVPVAVFGNNQGSSNDPRICMLDSLGQLYFAGYWPSDPPISNAEIDHEGNFESNEDYIRMFAIGWTQPEKITDWIFTSYNEDMYLAAGESGTVYGGGSNTWYSAGIYNTANGFHAIK